MSSVISHRGGFAVGVVVGLLGGLVLALSVALYIAKVPVPFVNKVPGRTAEQDNAEAERNRSWDPNAPLAGRAPRAGASAGGVVVPTPGSAPVIPPPAGAQGATAAAPGAAGGSARDPAAILSGAPTPTPPRSTAAGGEPFVFFVQAGAYTRNDDAEQQRAKLALMGQTAQISEREQAGRTVYRVRVGPFRTRDDADALLVKLQAAGVDSQIVRVERQP
ncbi:MAG: SPOR domain-containing protein [Rubrivivax sp.]|nr:SPOR domain-containing protein [Rubrivivax sp.]